MWVVGGRWAGYASAIDAWRALRQQLHPDPPPEEGALFCGNRTVDSGRGMDPPIMSGASPACAGQDDPLGRGYGLPLLFRNRSRSPGRVSYERTRPGVHAVGEAVISLPLTGSPRATSCTPQAARCPATTNYAPRTRHHTPPGGKRSTSAASHALHPLRLTACAGGHTIAARCVRLRALFSAPRSA